MIKTTSYAYILYIYIFDIFVYKLFCTQLTIAISISRGVQFSTIYINVCKYQLIQYCGKAYREGIESYIYISYIFRVGFISFDQFQFFIRIYLFLNL